MDVHEVMDCVPGCRNHGEALVADVQWLAAVEGDDARGGDGQKLAPQHVHLIAVDAGCTGDELGRVDQMRQRALVHIQGHVRVAVEQGPGGTPVVEVDVGEHDGADVVKRQPMHRQCLG